jgi:hypothetical protein
VTDHAIEVAFLPETSETFAHRRTAHAVLAREHHFRERRPRPIAAFDYPRLDAAVGALDLRRIRADDVVTGHVYAVSSGSIQTASALRNPTNVLF